MTHSAAISCTAGNGETLEKLSQILQKRSEVLGELTKDATIATAIDVLVSLRADTKDARKSKKWAKVAVKSCGGMYLGFRKENKAPCIRRNDRYTGDIIEGAYLRITDRGLKAADAKIFHVTPQHDKTKPYYLAARCKAAAMDYERARVRRRIETKGGLARTALGIAMAKISTKNNVIDSPALARTLASKLAQISVSGGGFGSGEFGVAYSSQLDYAFAALKTGENSVNLAMQKAANKIAGHLTHTLHKAGDLDHDIPAPFPEVKRK